MGIARWPEYPYKAFSSYGPEDAMLLAGRERQTVEFARLLARPDTRLIFLHGLTGCGKSSFLRAGLIPFLEGHLQTYRFFREQSAGEPISEALFIRSTGNPLGRLASEVFRLTEAPFPHESPFGHEYIDLSAVRMGQENSESFVASCTEDPRLLVSALERLSGLMPGTVALVVDQAEEVLTLNSDEAVASPKPFFRFLGLFARSRFNLKILITLRTEYYGRFLAHTRREVGYDVTVKDYLLEELAPADLLAAMLRPTSTEPSGDLPAPRERYGFSFQKNLPEKVVDDIVLRARAGGMVGGRLPVLQVVCDRLYRNSKARAGEQRPWTITFEDYDQLEGVEFQVGDYVDEILGKFFVRYITTPGAVKDVVYPTVQTAAWKDVLSSLARTQVDNTVVTDLVHTAKLRQAANDLGAEEFDALTTHLCDDAQSLLRPERKHHGAESAIEGFSLRHDVIGLSLLQWKRARIDLGLSNRFYWKSGLAWMLGPSLLAVMILLFVDRSMITRNVEPALGLGLVWALSGLLISNSRWLMVKYVTLAGSIVSRSNNFSEAFMSLIAPFTPVIVPLTLRHVLPRRLRNKLEPIERPDPALMRNPVFRLLYYRGLREVYEPHPQVKPRSVSAPK